MSYSKKSATPTTHLEYKEYTTARGFEIKIYPVPTNIVRGITPKKKKPKRPVIEMKIAGGKSQTRAIKETDEGWEEYLEELEEWDDERKELQESVSMVLALKDFKYPDPLIFPAEIMQLADDGLIELPDDKYLRKNMYLETVVLGEHDRLEIGWIINLLSGVPEDMVDEMKDSFRNIILGKRSRNMGKNNRDNGSSEEGDD